MSVADSIDIGEGFRPSGPRTEDVEAVRCYRQAMDRILTLRDDPDFSWSLMLLTDLHFMVCHFQPRALPGRLRKEGVGGFREDRRLERAAPQVRFVPEPGTHCSD